MIIEPNQQELDDLFVKKFGGWDNPILHLSASELDVVEKENKWWDAISKARHIAKKDYPVVDNFIRKSVYGISKPPNNGILIWKGWSATGAVRRDMKTNVPYLQVMNNNTFELIWLNMKYFDGFVGNQYFEFGKRKDWITGNIVGRD